MGDPQQKTVLITGCSSGFGLLTAARLCSKGYHVIATMRNLDKSGPLEEEIRQRGGGRYDLLPLDVTDPDSVKHVITEIGDRFGYVHVLVNNAGFGLGGFFEDLDDVEIRGQMDVNFFGVLNVTRAIIPFMRHQRWGKIINISSIAGLTASPCFGAYTASKWALEGFSESLMYELKCFGIDVCLIEPGTYKTKIFYDNARYGSRFNDEHSPYVKISSHMSQRVKEYVDGCQKDPEDIAALVEKLIKSKRPSFRNIPDLESQCHYLLRKFLPFALYKMIYRKIVFEGVPKDAIEE